MRKVKVFLHFSGLPQKEFLFTLRIRFIKISLCSPYEYIRNAQKPTDFNVVFLFSPCTRTTGPHLNYFVSYVLSFQCSPCLMFAPGRQTEKWFMCFIFI